MNENNLKSISPIDGRYSKISSKISSYFSEYAFIKYRVYVEIEYFKALCDIPLKQLASISSSDKKKLVLLHLNFHLKMLIE